MIAFVSSAIFVFSMIITIALFLMLPKANAPRRESFLLWLAISIVSFYCYEAFAGGIANLAGIPINLFTLTAINTIASVLMLLHIRRHKQIQQYVITWYDVTGLLLLFVGIIYFCVFRYGTALIPTYETSDPGTHLKMAVYLVKEGQLSEMYFGPLFNAIHIMLLKPLFDFPNHYKAFILSDMLAFALSGLVFLALIQALLKGWPMKIAGLLFSIFYMLGYPLCNHLFGFSYLGIGVMLISFLMLLMQVYLCGEHKNKLLVLLLMMSLYALSVCYVLFIPFVAVALLATVTAKYISEKRLITLEFVTTCVQMFLLPFVLCLCYMLKFSHLMSGGSLAAEGYINRDLYTNFIMIAPVSLFGVLACYKKRQWFPSILAIAFFLYMLAMLFFTLKGSVSTYYFYKTHYVLWLLCFYLAVAGCAALYETARGAMVSWGIITVAIIGMAIGNVDGFLQERVYLVNPQDSANTRKLAQIYVLNQYYTENVSVKYTDDDMALNSKGYEYANNPDTSILPVFDWLDTFWFEAMTAQNYSNYYTWFVSDFEAYLKRIADDGFDYVAVRYAGEFYKNHADYFNQLERVYENSVGFIAKYQ